MQVFGQRIFQAVCRNLFAWYAGKRQFESAVPIFGKNGFYWILCTIFASQDSNNEFINVLRERKNWSHLFIHFRLKPIKKIYIFNWKLVLFALQGALYLRNFQFKRSLKLPRIVPGKWLLEFEFYLAEFELFTFSVKIHLEVKPIGWHLFEFELNWSNDRPNNKSHHYMIRFGNMHLWFESFAISIKIALWQNRFILDFIYTTFICRFDHGTSTNICQSHFYNTHFDSPSFSSPEDTIEPPTIKMRLITRATIDRCRTITNVFF